MHLCPPLQGPFAAGQLDINRERLYLDAFEQLEPRGSAFRLRTRVSLHTDVSRGGG